MEVQPVPAWGTIPRMLRDQASGHPDVEVVVAGPVRLTLAELAARAGEVARALIALGVSPGDRVAVWGPNDPDWVVAAYGIWDAGAVIAPLSTRFKGLEAAGLLRKTGAKVLLAAEGFMGASYLEMIEDAELPDLQHRVVLGGGPAPSGALGWADFLAGGAAVSAGAAEERALGVGRDDLASIMATSGTTGAPKGVMLHHSQLLRGYWDWAELVTLREGDRYPIIAPFSHGFGINAGLLACVLRRATMMPVALFRPEELMDLIERDRISVLAGAPPMFFKILDELEGRDVSSLRVAICGAAAVPPELIRRLVDRVGLDRMINAYGLMEGTVVSMTRAGDPVEVIASSTGRAVPGVSVRVVGEDGKDLPPGEPGEILVGGYGVMRGYWRDPERTAEAVDPGGWLHTGDIGTLDDAGNLAIVDRKKEMFIVSGFNAYPAEIEGLLLRCPLVGQVAVIGVPDAEVGEVGRAYVVPPPGTAVDAEGIIAWARANMSNYKVPRRVVALDALPVNANGKIDKPALHALAAEEG
ncbi:AMP-binding protein [Actinomadura macrotermitis]|uniref:3-[(3aS,4S,7aS)-7a-methyl-1, 5-dioxo-octahydro-1H-inden-4-yl]propanoyl:CoA ligase n=1 Tax=Actinomadura macrotermitis TaxID=2585200 RepID=A0A7K0BNW4_9ACTN|nr:AMP-binding protein [Actinomadura macrotermitis]MQY02865.1 3-[(3aS,4S,7aS)-7a-methyl-1,5-dioxo-octahydro-1H-inden-4-yl]propanoyl:CoA ligase [Actinomadura macrotermitis]